MKSKIMGFGVGLLATASLAVLAQISGGGVEGGGGQPSGSPFAIQYKNGNKFGGTGPGTSGQVLTSRGAGLAPTFQAAGGSTVPNTVQGDTLFASATNVLSALTKDTNATRYLANTGTNNNPAWAQVNLANGVTGTLPAGNGGTGAATLSGVLRGNGTSAVTSATNADIRALWTGSCSSANFLEGSGTCNPVNLGSQVTGTLPVANGGTNLTSATDDNVMVGNGTTWQSKAMPDCQDTTGNHLNYTQSSNSFTCGTSISTAGTFTATLTGCTANPTGTAKYVIAGQMVTLMLPGMSCTSNATTATITGAPAAIFPATVQNLVVAVTDNGTAQIGRAQIGTNGVITLSLGFSGGAFTNTGTKALSSTYPFPFVLN